MIRKLLLAIILLFLFIRPLFAQTDNSESKEKAILDSINESVVGERIKNFDSKIQINLDGSIDVTETINYYFDTDKHGIFRYIPFTKRNSNNKRVDLTFDFNYVRNLQLNNYKYNKSISGDQWVLKIGDANKTITGDHTYIISYKVKGAIGYFNDHDELYWNVTGTGWPYPIQKTTATITLPKKLNLEQIQLKCFTGAYGSSKQNCTASTDGQTSTFKTTLFLNSNEGLTTVLGFPKNTVAVLLPTEYIPFFERWYGKIVLALIIIGAIFWYVILPVYLVFKWFREGRDPYVGIPVTATFDPPVGANNKPLTPVEAGSLLDETVETRDIFSTIVDLARRGYLRINEPEKKDFYLDHTKNFKKDDKLQPFEKDLLDGIFKEGELVRLKDVKLYETVSQLKEMLYKNMVENGFFTKNPDTTRKIYYAVGFVSLFTLNFVTAFIAFIFGRHMPKKTLFGAQQAQVAKGLKNFLSSQERQLNFQGDKQMFFEKLLPFAVAFGVEKAWAKRFEALDLKNPDWYQGTTGTNFNTAIFASSLHNSYNNFAISSTPPSSSSSSGFGGGGFSGGGGGGGGGGSW